MSSTFKTVDYEAALNASISVREAPPADHLARFVVEQVLPEALNVGDEVAFRQTVNTMFFPTGC